MGGISVSQSDQIPRDIVGAADVPVMVIGTKEYKSFRTSNMRKRKTKRLIQARVIRYRFA